MPYLFLAFINSVFWRPESAENDMILGVNCLNS